MKLPMSVLRDLSGKPFRFNLKNTNNIKSSKAVLAHSKSEASKYDLDLKGSILSDDSLDTSDKETFEISNLLPAISILEKYNFKYEVMPEELVKNSGLFFQDKCMNAFFQCYPEYLCIDILCEIADLEYDLCLFISVDANGHSEIIAIGLIKSYNSQGLMWLCEVFRKHNPSWRKIQFIMSGKNIDCTETVKKAFPEKLVFISLFHSLKAFKRDLSDLEKVSTHDISEALRLFEHMVYTNTELEYSDLAKQMKQLHPSVVMQFRKIWHPKSDSWALGLLFNSKAILKSLNSFLLFIRNKVRPHVINQVSITSIIKAFHSALRKLREDRFKKFASVFYSVPTLFCGKSNACIKYSKYLTQYASELVNEQLNLLDDVKNLKRISPGNSKPAFASFLC
ncbi:uncharacterized protein LOC129218819 [Uloborus diversus]|uniref:uncharacterized protein LOC129218819 n=1 Tax=Uloborus diversus TaxID=327109 RepID=UPI002409C327|nr:uncharacterized protein LOC129218819 [Uloborus diversus]